MNLCITAVPLNMNVFACFMHDVFNWMKTTANEKNVPESGRQGGIIFDEVSIQRDLQLDSRAGETRLSGSVNLEREGHDLYICYGVQESNGKNNNIVLASNVLQTEFVGFSRFVFPFAHFVIWCACSGGPLVTCRIMDFMLIFVCSMGPGPTGHS